MRKFILSFAYVGFLPGAPGTYASVIAFAIFCVGTSLGAPPWVWPVFAALAALVLLLVGVPADTDTGSGGDGKLFAGHPLARSGRQYQNIHAEQECQSSHLTPPDPFVLVLRHVLPVCAEEAMSRRSFLHEPG